MFIPGAIELILIVGLLLLVVISLVSFFRKKDVENKESRRGKILGCGLGVVILFGIGIGLFKLANPEFIKSGAIAIESMTSLPAEVSQPDQINYYIQIYRGAIVLDVWSLRLVFPDRGPKGFFDSSMSRGTKTIGKDTPSWTKSLSNGQLFGDAQIAMAWSSPGSGSEDEGKGILTLSIDEAVVHIRDGIAEIDGFQIPVTGPIQVVFLDPLGGVEEIRKSNE